MNKISTITIVSQYFYPSLSATSQLMTDLGEGLSNPDYYTNVNVVTATKARSGDPNKKLEQINQITRIFSPIEFTTGILGKIINSLFFVLGCLIYIFFQQHRQSRLFLASNPPYIGVIGLFFKFIKGGKYYFLLQDIFPESAVMAGILAKNSFIFKIFDRSIYLICKHAQNVIVLNSDMQDFLGKKYSDINYKIVTIENWAIEDIPEIDKQDNKFARNYNLDRKFTVSYSGNMGRLHDIETILEAAKMLKDEPIQFVFIGDGAKTQIIKENIEKNHLTNILLLPFQPRQVLPLSLTACDLSLVSLLPGAESIVAPSKLYGILAAGRGIIAISSANSYIDRLIKDYNCGVNVSPYDSQALANLILELSQQPLKVAEMGANARQLYKKQYTFARGLDDYKRIVLDL